MSVLSRSLVAACAGFVLLGTAGCGPGGLAGDDSGEPSAPPQEAGLAGVDPCAVLSPEKLTELGLEGPGQPLNDAPSEPGCDYMGDVIGATVSKNQGKTVESYAKQANWAKFESTDVNGRVGASAVDKGATQARICSAMFNAGGGVIVVDVSETRPGNLDECGEALKIAKLIEPNVPK